MENSFMNNTGKCDWLAVAKQKFQPGALYGLECNFKQISLAQIIKKQFEIPQLF